MATVKEVTGPCAFQLTLSEDEAGYLFDLLYRHVGGRLTTRGHALSTICFALEEANVPERRAQNNNYIAGVVQYAVLDEIETEFNELRYS